jgi:hypothetical protein
MFGIKCGLLEFEGLTEYRRSMKGATINGVTYEGVVEFI